MQNSDQLTMKADKLTCALSLILYSNAIENVQNFQTDRTIWQTVNMLNIFIW